MGSAALRKQKVDVKRKLDVLARADAAWDRAWDEAEAADKKAGRSYDRRIYAEKAHDARVACLAEDFQKGPLFCAHAECFPRLCQKREAA